MDIALMFIVLFVVLFLTVPIGVTLGITTLVLMLFTTNLSPQLLAQSAFNGLDSFTLLAIPFFIVAGSFMQYGGISRRLLNLSSALIGHIRSGLPAVTTISCMFFAAISGSGPATVSAIGSFMIPEMKDKGYPGGFGAAISACAGSIGVIIPPSIPFIIYAVAAGCSVSQLFLAGVIPGVIIGVALMITSYILTRKHGWGEYNQRATKKEIWKAFRESILALLAPVIVLGSIYTGICSPTEAAVAGVAYSYVVGTFVYRELKWKDVKKSMIDASMISGTTLFMVGITTCLGRILVLKQIPVRLSDMFTTISDNPVVIMLMITALLLVVGCFMDNISATIILTPILLPTVLACGLTVIQFGVVMTANLAIGFITPPYGINLFVANQISGVPILQIARSALPLMISMFIVLLMLTFIPGLSMGLVNLFG